MGRKPRVWHCNQFYHIISRRNHRDALFLDNGDYKTFLHILAIIYQKYPFELPCYCLMTNHYHFMLRSKEHSISKIMSLVNKRYADYYNTKYRLNGHLFEKRFFSKEVSDDDGILQVSRYIHRNPLEANMVKILEEYPWSSYPLYMKLNMNIPPYANRQIVLRYFGGSEEEKGLKYKDYCLN
ncbi:transposase [Metabacillus halosaccharovorans]|uniref:transposase n=1 Tax=Metabacillus halosaccharovorans TaxID=930124 RepID=UPI00403D813C